MAHKRTVRPDTLRCSRCRKWKPDEEFGTSRWHKSRRERRYQCRDCEAQVARIKRGGS